VRLLRDAAGVVRDQPMRIVASVMPSVEHAHRRKRNAVEAGELNVSRIAATIVSGGTAVDNIPVRGRR
jgi:hypothetical protein